MNASRPHTSCCGLGRQPISFAYGYAMQHGGRHRCNALAADTVTVLLTAKTVSKLIRQPTSYLHHCDGKKSDST